jgi:hypothetical protein
MRGAILCFDLRDAVSQPLIVGARFQQLVVNPKC